MWNLAGPLAMGDGEIVGMVVTLCLFGWIPLKVIVNYRLRLAEIRSRQVGNVDGLREEIAQLKAEMQALRETSTKFDISFDAALTSLEGRVDNMEVRRAATIEESPTLRAGRG